MERVKLLKVELTNKGVYKIYLKITKQFTKNQEILKSISKDAAILDGFLSQESERICRLLEGNKLIRRIEIRNSVITEEIMKKVENIRATTNVAKSGIKLRSNKIPVSSLSILAYYFSTESLNEIFVANTIDFFEEKVRRANWEDEGWKMKKLILDEKPLRKLLKTGQFDSLIEKIQDEEEQISSLNFSIRNLQISDEKFKSLLRCIKSFRSLEKIDLKFNPKNLASDKSIDLLCQAIKRHTALQSLSLELPCSDSGLDRLRNALIPLTSLQYLSLDFAGSRGISNEGLSHLKSALEPLTSLQYLSLNFRGHKKISDDSVGYLTSAIKDLVNLQHLWLNFEECDQISNQGFHHLKTSLRPLVSLQNLALSLKGCRNISEQETKDLNEVLVPSLISLSLSLPSPKNFHDEGFPLLITSTLKSLVNLQNLSLHFGSTSDKSLNHLKNTFLALFSLQNLSLAIFDFGKISEKGFTDFQEGLKSLTNLRHLSLDIAIPNGMTDKWLVPLKGGLQLMVSLQSFSLRFGGLLARNYVSDLGLISLKEALMPLTSLTSLHLDLKKAGQITDQGIFSLADALILLVSLESFSLNLRRCEIISDSGVGHLAKAISRMRYLQYLSIDFGHCGRVSVKGMRKIKNTLPNLGFLQSLALDFTECNGEYTIEGMSFFTDVMKYIPYISLKGPESDVYNAEEDNGFERIKRL